MTKQMHGDPHSVTPDPFMLKSQLPLDCPRCSKPLYPISTLRPPLKQSLIARLGTLISGVTALVLYFGLYLIVRFAFDVALPARGAVFLAIPAILVGILVAVPFHWLPRVVRYDCKSCGWWERFSVTRDPSPKSRPAPIGKYKSPLQKAQPQVDPEAQIKAPSPTISDLGEIVDDSQNLLEAKFWASLQFARGQSAVEIHQQLRAAGWSAPAAEDIVRERCKPKRKGWW